MGYINDPKKRQVYFSRCSDTLIQNVINNKTGVTLNFTLGFKLIYF